MKDFVLEACVDSVESALAAVKGGATRLELCSNLVIGGTTPSQWLYEEIRKESDIRIHALIRPLIPDIIQRAGEPEILIGAVYQMLDNLDQLRLGTVGKPRAGHIIAAHQSHLPARSTGRAART